METMSLEAQQSINQQIKTSDLDAEPQAQAQAHAYSKI